MPLKQNLWEDTVARLDVKPAVTVGPRATVRAFLVHQGSPAATKSRALVPGASAIPWSELVDEL